MPARRCATVLVFVMLAGLATPGSAADRLQASGPVVYDAKSDLTWQRCAFGQRWEEQAGGGGGRCSGMPARIGFDAAKRLEGKGWRVPTLDELVSIVRKGPAPTIDSEVFPDTPSVYFWATDNRDTTSAWYVSFSDGRTNHYFPPRTNEDSVRFVRTGPWTRDVGPARPTR